MRILAALLAGGQSRRFGSDKALYSIDGVTLIEHSIAALQAQSDALVICGRTWHELTSIADIPDQKSGPLAGLNAALQYAKIHDFDGVLAAPLDVYPLPRNLAAMLVGDRPATLTHQHLISWWPVELSDALSSFVAGGDRAVHKWIMASNARKVADPDGLVNINSLDDLRV